MDRKIVEIIHRNKGYGFYDFKVKLECGHYQWFWNGKKDLKIGDIVDCSKCDMKSAGLKVFL